jgi:hypothetical protein
MATLLLKRSKASDPWRNLDTEISTKLHSGKGEKVSGTVSGRAFSTARLGQAENAS